MKYPHLLGLILSVWFANHLSPAVLNLPAAEREDSAPVPVLLWFDTEDYLLPADDDATKRLAELLSARGIRATFKIVGEKARVLERRGRQDVIEALRKHTIAYHANWHSVHPTPSEYLADCGWQDGIEEFIRREGRGAEDVKRIFKVQTLACYGQPGSSWAPQAIGALGRMGVSVDGVPCYIDEGSHVGLNNAPFWYAGALVVYDMGPNCTRTELHSPNALEPAKQQVAAIAERLRQHPGSSLISIYYHPCEWVHQQFWDGVNFKRGANPPREQWQAPPQLPPEATEQAFQRFTAYIDYIQGLPGVRFITASDLPARYPDAVHTQGAGEQELLALARALAAPEATDADFQLIGAKAFSLADQFELLTRAVVQLIKSEHIDYPLRAQGLLGPNQPPPAPTSKVASCSWLAFRDTTLDVDDFIQTERRVPARVFIGAESIPPINYLVALARTVLIYEQTKQLPRNNAVDLSRTLKLLPERHVAEDTPDLFGGWIIHPEGFRAPQILKVARWQAWTLKPALCFKSGMR